MTIKIYFAGSIRGGRNDKTVYLDIIKHLTKHGLVLTEHVGDKSLSELGEEGTSDIFIYNRDLSWLKESDIIVAEVTTPSLGVGYEIAKAEEMNKPILCLFHNNKTKRLSAMIKGNNNLKIIEYDSLTNVKKLVDDFFKKFNKK